MKTKLLETQFLLGVGAILLLIVSLVAPAHSEIFRATYQCQISPFSYVTPRISGCSFVSDINKDRAYAHFVTKKKGRNYTELQRYETDDPGSCWKWLRKLVSKIASTKQFDGQKHGLAKYLWHLDKGENFGGIKNDAVIFVSTELKTPVRFLTNKLKGRDAKVYGLFSVDDLEKGGPPRLSIKGKYPSDFDLIFRFKNYNGLSNRLEITQRNVLSWKISGSLGELHSKGTCTPLTNTAKSTLAEKSLQSAFEQHGPTPTARLTKQQSHEKRFALMIGNNAYETQVLKNPIRDTKLIGQALETYGFAVTYLSNVNRREFVRGIYNFKQELMKAGRNPIALFYYSGHGVEYNGRNYLMPVGSQKLIDRPDDYDLEAVSADRIQSDLAAVTNGVKIILLDACRDNKFVTVTRSARRGLAPMSASLGTIIGFSTASGSVSVDGDGQNSPYALALAQAIRTPGLNIEGVLKKTRNLVLKFTNAKQVTWDHTSLTAEFYFQK